MKSCFNPVLPIGLPSIGRFRRSTIVLRRSIGKSGKLYLGMYRKHHRLYLVDFLVSYNID